MDGLAVAEDDPVHPEHAPGLLVVEEREESRGVGVGRRSGLSGGPEGRGEGEIAQEGLRRLGADVGELLGGERPSTHTSSRHSPGGTPLGFGAISRSVHDGEVALGPGVA